MLENHQRQELYRFFAKIFTYPDADLLESLDDELNAAAAILGLELPERRAGQALEDLSIAYTELFISRFGGVPAPPYGSVYLEEDRQLMGQTTQYVLQAYEGEGLSHAQGGEPPDFIATEMEFLYFLVGQEIAAEDAGERETALAARQKQIDFCHTLLQPWVRLFSQRLLEVEDAEPLYRWAGRGLLAFCRHEEELYGVAES